MNVAMTKSKADGAAKTGPLRVAVLGIGWWSDVLADAIKRSSAIEIAACFTRSKEKRAGFAVKYGCRAAASYEDILADGSIAAIVNTTPNNVHLETTQMAAATGKHVFLDKPIANTVAEGREIARICEAAGVVLALGYQRRRENHSAGSRRRSTPAGSAGWCRRNATSAATVSARSTCRPGATRRRACRAASCCRSASIMSTCWKCCWAR
jgi:Oxidoreductase family, NAD-binding Rossmann fold